MESPFGLLFSSLDLFGLLRIQMRADRKLLEFSERAIVAARTFFAIVFPSMFKVARGIVFHDLPLSRHLILRTDEHQMR
jgi:hypothetical protein